MRNASGTVERTKPTARTVMTIHIDIGQLVAAVRRHVPISPKAALAIRNDFATLFSTTRVAVVSRARNGKTTAAGDRAMNSPPSATQ
jgi:hypothetical protein